MARRDRPSVEEQSGPVGSDMDQTTTGAPRGEAEDPGQQKPWPLDPQKDEGQGVGTTPVEVGGSEEEAEEMEKLEADRRKRAEEERVRNMPLKVCNFCGEAVPEELMERHAQVCGRRPSAS